MKSQLNGNLREKRETNWQKFKRNILGVNHFMKRELKIIYLTVCTATNTRKTSLATKSLNFILRHELSTNNSTWRWNCALQVVQCEKANPSYRANISLNICIQFSHKIPNKGSYLDRSPMIKTRAMDKLLGAFAHAWWNQFVLYKNLTTGFMLRNIHIFLSRKHNNM